MKKRDRSSIIELRNKLKVNLSPERYEHSLGVEFTAASLAMAHGIDINKAEIAGLLHDCAKHVHDETKVSHAFFGPEVAKEVYGIEDKEILSAIKWHTTGKADMTDLEKIIFIADFIEPGRAEISLLEEARDNAFKDLSYTVFLISQGTIKYLNSKGTIIDNHTVECFEYLKENGIHDN